MSHFYLTLDTTEVETINSKSENSVGSQKSDCQNRVGHCPRVSGGNAEGRRNARY